MKKWISSLFLFIGFFATSAQQIKHTEVLVIGGTTGGTAAGIQSARSGAQTLIVEETNMLGGMLTAAGVSCVDGNDQLKSGMWQQFREALYKHYGTSNLASGWVSNNCFEPHVGDSIFKAWAGKEANLSVQYGWFIDTVYKTKNTVTGAKFINQQGQLLLVYAAVVVDATENGDVFAITGAGYDIGMEDSTYSGEKEAPGKNDIIQDLTWAAILKDYGNGVDKSIQRPVGYNKADYYCSTSDAFCVAKPYKLNTQKVLDYGRLTSKDSLHPKYMLNWPVHGNDTYLNAVQYRPIERAQHYDVAKQKTQGFLYFIQQELGFKQIGFADDELDKGMAFMPYNREGRRLKGVIRLNINHIKNTYQYQLYKTGIAVGDYPVDHHHDQYPGEVPNIDFPNIPSFSIPLGALIPAGINGLIVCEKGISVSNIANGTTRLQPVVLLTGQAAGMMAAQCIKNKKPPSQVNLTALQNELLQNKAYLQPFCDIEPADSGWLAMQKLGSLGILKGTGKSEAWENKMFVYPDSLMLQTELEANLAALIKPSKNILREQHVTLSSLASIINSYNKIFISQATYHNKVHHDVDWQNLSADHTSLQAKTPITRRQIAMLLYQHLLLIRSARITLKGDVVFN